MGRSGIIMDGRLVGHYRIVEKIGAGAMGDVYRARDERLQRDVALKVIRPASSDNPDHLRRFEHEARAAAALNHPNILAVYDVGFDSGSPYIVSELLKGKTLRQRMQEGPISLREASGYALQIAQGLTAAHDHLIVHRDLKPENLFITHDDRIKILDFGVAKRQVSPEDQEKIQNMPTVTKHGTVIGTVAYMSPEQLRGKTVDHRSDIFSFGAILYEMLSESRAFHGETDVDTMTAVLREEPTTASLDEAAVPPAYQDVVKHCLEKDPENRFQSAKDLAFALQTISGPSSGKGIRFPKPRTAKTLVLPWGIAAVLAVATTFLAVTDKIIPPPPTYSRLTFEAGTIYSARFAPNGQSVVYSAAWDDKPVQLFSTVGNSNLSQPLQFADANLLSISRTNELALVLRGTHNGQLETMNGMLADAPLAGGSPREVLSDVRWADWDSNGKLAVVHYVEAHCRIEYPIGNVLYQSGGWVSNIRFSPKGDSIAFMDHPALWDNRGTVRTVDLSGHVRTLTTEWGSESGLAWRPDGREIWFTAIEKGNTLNLKAVDLSGRLRTLLDLPMAIAIEDISSDGRVLISLNSKRLAMAYSTLGERDGVDLSWHDWNSAHDISFDGKFVLFEDASEAAGAGYAVAIRNVDGSLPVRLGEGSSGGLSPDGKWAISVSTSQAPQITLLPTGAGQPRTINVTDLAHIQNGWARFLPDGQHLAVIGDEAGHAPRCYQIELSGRARPATPEGVRCGPLSPDGRSIVGVSPDRSITLYSLDGGSSRFIPHLQNNFVAVQWSANGLFLFGYHLGEFPSKVYRVDIKGGAETVVQELKPGVPAGVVLVAPIVVSRDGRRFAYSYNQTLSSLYLVSGLH